jgi:hypothetical protein
MIATTAAVRLANASGHCEGQMRAPAISTAATTSGSATVSGASVSMSRPQRAQPARVERALALVDLQCECEQQC